MKNLKTTLLFLITLLTISCGTDSISESESQDYKVTVLEYIDGDRVTNSTIATMVVHGKNRKGKSAQDLIKVHLRGQVYNQVMGYINENPDTPFQIELIQDGKYFVGKSMTVYFHN